MNLIRRTNSTTVFFISTINPIYRKYGIIVFSYACFIIKSLIMLALNVAQNFNYVFMRSSKVQLPYFCLTKTRILINIMKEEI